MLKIAFKKKLIEMKLKKDFFPNFTNHINIKFFI